MAASSQTSSRSSGSGYAHSPSKGFAPRPYLGPKYFLTAQQHSKGRCASSLIRSGLWPTASNFQHFRSLDSSLVLQGRMKYPPRPKSATPTPSPHSCHRICANWDLVEGEPNARPMSAPPTLARAQMRNSPMANGRPLSAAMGTSKPAPPYYTKKANRPPVSPGGVPRPRPSSSLSAPTPQPRASSATPTMMGASGKGGRVEAWARTASKHTPQAATQGIPNPSTESPQRAARNAVTAGGGKDGGGGRQAAIAPQDSRITNASMKSSVASSMMAARRRFLKGIHTEAAPFTCEYRPDRRVPPRRLIGGWRCYFGCGVFKAPKPVMPQPSANSIASANTVSSKLGAKAKPGKPKTSIRKDSLTPSVLSRSPSTISEPEPPVPSFFVGSEGMFVILGTPPPTSGNYKVTFDANFRGFTKYGNLTLSRELIYIFLHVCEGPWQPPPAIALCYNLTDQMWTLERLIGGKRMIFAKKRCNWPNISPRTREKMLTDIWLLSRPKSLPEPEETTEPVVTPTPTPTPKQKGKKGKAPPPAATPPVQVPVKDAKKPSADEPDEEPEGEKLPDVHIEIEVRGLFVSLTFDDMEIFSREIIPREALEEMGRPKNPSSGSRPDGVPPSEEPSRVDLLEMQSSGTLPIDNMSSEFLSAATPRVKKKDWCTKLVGPLGVATCNYAMHISDWSVVDLPPEVGRGIRMNSIVPPH